MIHIIKERLLQKKRTHPFPQKPVSLPERYRGRPQIHFDRCEIECQTCIDLCPTEALSKKDGKLEWDLGRCVFCPLCVEKCPHQALSFSTDYSLATRTRSDLILNSQELKKAESLHQKILSLYGRSLKLREVSAGGCNACEADTNVLNTLFFDLGRFGIQFVASPRHADGLFITGPVSKNMELALKKTYAAIPGPKIVIATGACAISGGIFRKNAEVHRGAEELIPIDLFIPGCPPHPMTILDGMLRLLDKLPK